MLYSAGDGRIASSHAKGIVFTAWRNAAYCLFDLLVQFSILPEAGYQQPYQNTSCNKSVNLNNIDRTQRVEEKPYGLYQYLTPQNTSTFFPQAF